MSSDLTVGEGIDLCRRGKDLALLLGGGGLAGVVVLGAGDLASYVFGHAPAVLIPAFVVGVLLTAFLIGMSYTEFDRQGRRLERLLDHGTVTAEATAPDTDRIRRAAGLRRTAMLVLLLTSLVLVAASLWVWLDPR
ncbi:MAG TPA: hypothetical protein VIU11_21480 [Nakamurella sp.]